MSVDWTSRQNGDTIKPRRRSIVTAIVVVAVILGAGIVYALLSQAIPSTPIPPATVSSTCGTSIITTSTITANSGALLYTCNGGGAAFTTVTGLSTPRLTGFTQCPVGTVTSPCYADFGYLTSTDTTDCVTGTTLGAWFHPIVNGTSQTFAVGSWNYCAIYAAPPGGGTLAGFTIGWA